MNKKGFSLVELLIYMAIVGIVVIIAGQAFGDSTKVRVRTQNMLKSNQIAETIGASLREDISQMGAKSSKGLQGNMILSEDVYMDMAHGDFSSFNLQADKDSNKDILVFRRVAYDGDALLRIEEISWLVRGDKLFRTCRTVSGTADATYCPAGEKIAEVEIASGIKEFMVYPAMPSINNGNVTMFPVNVNFGFRLLSRTGLNDIVPLTTNPELGGSLVNISGFASNYNPNPDAEPTNFYSQLYVKRGNELGNAWYTCNHFNFKKDSTYEISFSMPFNADDTRMFQAGKDHFSVGLRKIEGEHTLEIEDVHDFYFFPPMAQDGSGERKMRFSTHADAKDVCIVFTFGIYSPSVSTGTITISDLKVVMVADENYTFTESFRRQDFSDAATFVNKANVHAFRIRLKVDKGGEAGVSVVTIPVPSNGTRD